MSSGRPFLMARAALCSTCCASSNRRLKKSTRVGFFGMGWSGDFIWRLDAGDRQKYSCPQRAIISIPRPSDPP